jgi:UDP-N-acetylmuramate dehydrogenase
MTAMSRLVAAGLVRTDVELAGLTTYKLGGEAAFFAEPDEVGDLAAILAARSADRIPMVVLGRGSNLVIADDGFPGLVVRLGRGFTGVQHHAETIEAGAAVSLPMLARAAVGFGRLGLEFYVGIPGSVGGAVRQNAGCHGAETVDRLIEAELVRSDGRREIVPVSQLGLSYRHSDIGDDDVVTRAWFSFEPGDPAVGEERIREITRWRKEHQPGGTFNAGSVFKNPPGDAAGRLIDEAGLKGAAVGGASVSTKHANFFVATPDASAADVYGLVRLIRSEVERRTGVLLEPEIRFVGFEA